MKKFIPIIIMLFIMAQLIGQENQEPTIQYQIKDKKVDIKYEKVTEANKLKHFTKITPMYIFDSVNFNKIKASALLINSLNKQHEILINRKDATAELEEKYKSVIVAQEDRVRIYQNSYEQMKEINTDLSHQLENAIEIGYKSARRSKYNHFLYGTLSGLLVGTVIGVVIGN